MYYVPVQCSTSWLESVCFIILAKEIISWGIGAGGKWQVHPLYVSEIERVKGN